MSSRIVPVIFARLDSRRLPGKVLEPLLGGKSIIEELLAQVAALVQKRAEFSPPIVATTDRAVDEPIVRAAAAMGVDVVRGDSLPLVRLAEVARLYPQDWLWRLNADSPLLLQALIEKAAASPALEDGTAMITNLIERSFPYGVSLEMYRADTILGIDTDKATAQEREHITPIVKNVPLGAVKNIVADDLGLSRFAPDVRLTVDTEEDAIFFRSLWKDSEFRGTHPGSVERVECAYRKRLLNAT
ncbi:MAG: hypothetical protein HLX50_11565 [Alteromonadaceae bacterium]|nr:hypothetical protein [Alteromonadaceae bacterium]